VAGDQAVEVAEALPRPVEGRTDAGGLHGSFDTEGKDADRSKKEIAPDEPGGGDHRSSPRAARMRVRQQPARGVSLEQ